MSTVFVALTIQLAALGSDPVVAIQYAATTCQSQFVGQGTVNEANRSGTLLNSSGDSSLITDSNGCIDYSGSSFSGNYSFSTC